MFAIKRRPRGADAVALEPAYDVAA
jgi:hypothetical protein